MSLLQDLYKSAKKILKRISVIPLTFKKSFGNKYLDANFFQWNIWSNILKVFSIVHILSFIPIVGVLIKLWEAERIPNSCKRKLVKDKELVKWWQSR